MSEMFTKIGGFIASGDPLVYADSATMTGDGTVASPFGVNKTDLYVQSPLYTGTSGEGSATSAYIGFSGYNETLLWSGSKTWWNDTSELTLSGNVSDYESFKITYSDDWEMKPVINEYPGDNTAFDASLFGGEGDNLTFKTSKFTVNGNKINLNKSRTIEVNSAGNISTVIFTTSYIKFYKIVGINRKPEA